MVGKAIVGLALACLALPQAYAQVIASGPQGKTNPPKAELGTYNQTSVARLVTLNSIDDFCLYGGFGTNQTIGDIEPEVVAWCTKPRNNARLIPDGTFTGGQFIVTPSYVQLRVYGDLTKIGIQPGDQGGELDPHGPRELGNPIGGNVTTNVTGRDVSYTEWMMFVSHEQACFRICIAESKFSVGLMCEHKLDVMGCDFVMPANVEKDKFVECVADDASPPGLYTYADHTSTFRQYFEGTYTGGDGRPTPYAVGDKITPAGPQVTPPARNCKTVASIANGVTDIVTGASTSDSSTTTSGSSISTGSSSTGNSTNSRPTSSPSGSNTRTSTNNSTNNSTETDSGARPVTGVTVATFVLTVLCIGAPLLLFATY